MKFLKWDKDGGPDSPVEALYILEIKRLFSILLIRFGDGMRNKMHNHAFNGFGWLLKGEQTEYVWRGQDQDRAQIEIICRGPGFLPYWTPRSRMHSVKSHGTSWFLAFRGPWADTWQERDPDTGALTTLTHGRKVVN